MYPHALARSLAPWLTAVAVALIQPACSKGGKKQQAPDDPKADVKSNDALWALAPADTIFAVVVGDGVASKLPDAVATVKRSIASRPGGDKISGEIDEWLQGMAPIDVLNPTERAKYGIKLELGAAMFTMRSGFPVYVLPVADREKFRAAAGGEAKTVDGETIDELPFAACKEIANRYACALNGDALGLIGKSDATAKRVAKQLGSQRGHIELLELPEATRERNSMFSQFMSDIGMATAAITLGPGAITVRGHLPGSPKGGMAKAFLGVPDTLAKRAASDNPGGLWRLRVPVAALIPPDAVAELSSQLPPGVGDLAAPLKALTGELVLTSQAGDSLNMTIKIGATDASQFNSLIGVACNLAGATPGLDIKREGDRCVATVDPTKLDREGAELVKMYGKGPISMALFTEADAIVAQLDFGPRGDSKGPAADGIGKELATGKAWNVALWGRGMTVHESSGRLGKQLEGVPGADVISSILWGMAHLSELGFGVGLREDGLHAVLHIGTHFGNPDDVLTKYQTHVGKLIDGDSSAMQAITALAQASPNTPLGKASAAGIGGLGVIGGASIGVLAAVAIPAFVKYVNKSKTAEARVFVRKLYDGARMYYLDPPQPGLTPVPPHFPRTSVGPTPPLGTCCKNEEKKCLPDPTQWEHESWVALQFSVDDPHYYSYEYKVIDPEREFAVRAYGDLDCDGVYSTFEMRGIVDPSLGDGPTGSAAVRTIDELE